jgi:hypothetical protein
MSSLAQIQPEMDPAEKAIRYQNTGKGLWPLLSARGANLNGHPENKEATHWQWMSYVKCFDFSFVIQLNLVSKRTDFGDRQTTCIWM